MYYLLFSFELILLFFLSRFVTKTISQFLYNITKSEHAAVGFMALLFFPGTLLHELSHFFMAILCFVHVGTIEFMPKIRGDSVKLGSVEIGKTDPFRRVLIGLAPVLVGLLCIFSAVYYFSTFPWHPWFLNIIVLLYVIFEIGNTMFSSKKDVEGLIPLVIVSLIFFLAGYFLGFRIPAFVIAYFTSDSIIRFLQQLCLYMFLPIGIDAAILLLARVKRGKSSV